MTKRGNAIESDEVVKYALAELEYVRGQLRIFMDRFENLLTFYLTVFGAIVSAVAIVMTSAVHSIQNISLALFGAFAWVFSIVIFFRLCITRSMMVLQLVKERKVQEFFLTRHEQLRDLTVTILRRDNIGDWKKWRSVIYTPQTLLFFYLMAGFTGLLAVVTSVFTMNSISELASSKSLVYPPLWYIVVSLITFIFSLITCQTILWLQQKKAESYAQSILSGLVEQKIETKSTQIKSNKK